MPRDLSDGGGGHGSTLALFRGGLEGCRTEVRDWTHNLVCSRHRGRRWHVHDDQLTRRHFLWDHDSLQCPGNWLRVFVDGYIAATSAT